jgi:protein-tyrosine phosphatase
MSLDSATSEETALVVRVPSYSQIIPNLFITDWDSAESEELLERHKIVAVLTIETDLKSLRVLKMYKDRGIAFLQIKIDDYPEEDLASHLDKTYEFIATNIAKGGVVVHCMAGVSRSPAVVIDHLVRSRYDACKLPLDAEEVLNKAHNDVLNARPQVRPNGGFLHQLLERAQGYRIPCAGGKVWGPVPRPFSK